MSGWDNLEGKNARTGARVVENAKLRHPGHLGIPRAGPRRVARHAATADAHAVRTARYDVATCVEDCGCPIWDLLCVSAL
eukprot:1330507-Prymnesium_polylepis.1